MLPAMASSSCFADPTWSILSASASNPPRSGSLRFGRTGGFGRYDRDLVTGKGFQRKEESMLSPSTDRSRWSRGALLVALLMVLGGFQPALAQDAGQENAPQEQRRAGQRGEERAAGQPKAKRAPRKNRPCSGRPSIVTGYRHALEESVVLKRDAVNVRDSIVTEDIGKMPDLNLAEAIQRVPGVAIVREGGEGRNIDIRGLGADFTQVTLNGMEVPASTGGLDSSGGINRGSCLRLQRLPRRALLSHRHQQVDGGFGRRGRSGRRGPDVHRGRAGQYQLAGVGSAPDWLQRPVGGVGSADHGNLHRGEQGEDLGLHDLRGGDGAQLLAGWFWHRPLAAAGRELQGERDGR